MSKSEIIDAISCLKDKTTLVMGGISSNFVNKIADPISNPLYIIFSKSMESGEIPSPLKMAKIIPLFKSGDKSLMDNYRPIALLDTFSKIFEKIVCKCLTSFLESNEKITPFQFGFRKEHSTVHPMLHFMNFVSEKLEKTSCDCEFL
jgi:Notch-like protein